MNVSSSAGTRRTSQIAASKRMPISEPARASSSRSPPPPRAPRLRPPRPRGRTRCRRRGAAKAAPQPGDRVAVVHEPLHDQHGEDDQHDRDPQLVARDRALVGRAAALRNGRTRFECRGRRRRRRRARGRRGARLAPERGDRRRRTRARRRSRSGRTGPPRIARARSGPPAARCGTAVGVAPGASDAGGVEPLGRTVANGVGAGPDGPRSGSGRPRRPSRRPGGRSG